LIVKQAFFAYVTNQY